MLSRMRCFQEPRYKTAARLHSEYLESHPTSSTSTSFKCWHSWRATIERSRSARYRMHSEVRVPNLRVFQPPHRAGHRH
eukprot:3507512-Pyramimonas_sp.AAC.1